MDSLDDLQILELAKSLTSINAAQEILSNFFPLLQSKLKSPSPDLTKRGVDFISKELLPSDFKDWLPLVTTANGNCLFNSVSLALIGDESISALLRLLTVSELFANADFYAHHPQLKEVATAADYTVPAIISIFLSENKALGTYNGNSSTATQAMQVLAQQTARSYVYARQFHILALASIINKPIFVAYPDIPSAWRIKLACHGCFYPREALLDNASRKGLKSETIFVMWTRTTRSPLQGWEPNHFVLLTKSSATPSRMSYSGAVVYGKPTPAKKRKTTTAFHTDKQGTGKTLKSGISTGVIPPKKHTRSESQTKNMSTDVTPPKADHIRSESPKSGTSTDATTLPKHARNEPPKSEIPTATTSSEEHVTKKSPSSSSGTPPDKQGTGETLKSGISTGAIPPKKHTRSESQTKSMSTDVTSPKADHIRSESPKSGTSTDATNLPKHARSEPPKSEIPTATTSSVEHVNKKSPSSVKTKMSCHYHINAQDPSHILAAELGKAMHGVFSKPRVRRVKRKPSAGNVTIAKLKLNKKEDNRRPKTRKIHCYLKFDKSNHSEETAKDSELEIEEEAKETVRDSEFGVEEEAKEAARELEFGFEEEAKEAARDSEFGVEEEAKEAARESEFGVADGAVEDLEFGVKDAEETVKESEFGVDEEAEEKVKDNRSGDEKDDANVLPLKGQEIAWYTDKGVKASTNVLRTEERMKNAVIIDDNEIKGLVRGSATGSLSENIDVLVDKLSSAGSSKQQNHLSAMISIATFIMNEGLLIPTQQLAKKYKELKGLKDSTRIESARLLEVLTKHLNVVQIYIEGKGYIIENQGHEIIKVVDSLKNTQKNDTKIINQKVEEAVGSKYDTVMQYLDSKRDRDTLKAILTKITSVNFMTKLANVQDKRSFQRSKGLVGQNLELFQDMKNKVMLNSDLITDAERKKRNRLLQRMKLEKLRHIFKGRGRKLKSEEFPDLAGILQFAFGDGDRIDRAGGGLESHPRLTDTVLYRAADSNTIMRQARETILALAPEGFNISLSSCFNYTQNYREGTYQAKRHHSGRGINACLSLHKPPRTGVEQFVVNLHWSSHNVNITLDSSYAFPDNIMVDSKDAKAKIYADVSPVQKPGKTWRKIILPDHDWSRTAHNALTPMTHLFLKTESILEDEEENDLYFSVRRTGTAATLVNLSYFEPETVQRVFNEIFLLLNNPGLDRLFRNPQTGRLKEHFVFIVDNGPSEAPKTPLVRMWLVRLARVLGLKSVTQKSFAEYHSKRNPVERVHAAQNHSLSNEQFSSKGVHDDCKIGDSRHRENMEHMADEVRRCLMATRYGGNPCLALRGIGGEENFVFSDEEELLTFLAKSELRKNEDDLHYEPVKNKLWREVATVWNLNENFVGSYREDYQIVQNSFEEEGERTCWLDKYSTVVFNPDVPREENEKLFTMQPIPDYVRWLQTGGEMHYMPCEKLQQLHTQVVDDTPAAFLPSKILELTCKVFSHGIETILQSISFLSWCTEEDVSTFHKEFEERLDKSFANDKDRAYWSQDELYHTKTKDELQALCRQKGLPIEGKKHDCVKRLVEKMEREPPSPLNLYAGQLLSVPESVTEMAKLSVFHLREILRFHNILDCGTKDELVLRVGMLKAGRSYLAFHKEQEALKDLITAATSLITSEKVMHLQEPRVMHKRRRFLTPLRPSIETKRPRESAGRPVKNHKSFLPVPDGITLGNLQKVLDPLWNEISIYQQRDHTRNEGSGAATSFSRNCGMEALRLVGTRLKAHWTRDEIGNTGWKTGWYVGTVMKYDEDTDEIEIEFDTEKDQHYKYCVAKEFEANRLKVSQSTERKLKCYEEMFEVGTQVELKWTKEELSDTEWPAGWYEAEVQSSDYDDDEVNLVFVEEPGCVYTIPVLPNLMLGKLRLQRK